MRFSMTARSYPLSPNPPPKKILFVEESFVFCPTYKLPDAVIVGAVMVVPVLPVIFPESIVPATTFPVHR